MVVGPIALLHGPPDGVHSEFTGAKASRDEVPGKKQKRQSLARCAEIRAEMTTEPCGELNS